MPSIILGCQLYTYFFECIIFGTRTWSTWVWPGTKVGLRPGTWQRVSVAITTTFSQNILSLFRGIFPWRWISTFPWWRLRIRFLSNKTKVYLLNNEFTPKSYYFLNLSFCLLISMLMSAMFVYRKHRPMGHNTHLRNRHHEIPCIQFYMWKIF